MTRSSLRDDAPVVPDDVVAAVRSRAHEMRALIPWAILVIGLFLVLINPSGYYGGDWDDGKYLDAARAWVEHGPALGQDHWSLRWPLVLPLAGLMSLAGADRAILMLPGVAAYLGTVMLMFWATRRVFGTRAATVAAFCLLTTPELIYWATKLYPDTFELFLWSITLWSIWFAGQAADRAKPLMVLAGIGAGIAFGLRETSFGLWLAAALLCVGGFGPARRDYLWLFLPACLIVAAEQLLLWQASGQMFYRLAVDLRHIQIPSHDMIGETAPGVTAPLNPALMRRWVGGGPVHLNWLVDPWINFFLNIRFGFVFVLVLFLAAVVRPGTSERGRDPRRVLLLIAGCNIFVNLYVLALNPAPRMFLPTMAAMAILSGWYAARLKAPWAIGVVGAIFAVKLVLTCVISDVAPNFGRVVPMTAALTDPLPAPVHVNRVTASYLALAPAAMRARLTSEPAAVGDYYLAVSLPGDNEMVAPAHDQRWEVVGRRSSGQEPWTVVILRPIVNAMGLMKGYEYDCVQATLYRRLPDRS